MPEKPFIQIDREIITKIDNPTEAVVLSYIVHEQVSSFKNNNKIRRITNTEIASKLGINKSTVSRIKTKLYEKNLLVEDSPIPNPRIGKLVWNENNKSFDLDFIKTTRTIGFYGKEVETGRTYNYLTPIDETFNYFNYGFIKVDKEWFLNPEIDITIKYWVIFFKAFEKADNWTPTWSGIERCSCWKEEGIRKSYYKLRDEGWVHNDKTIDINLDHQRLQGKSYNIDFIQMKADKASDEEVEELMKDIPSAEEQLLEMINEKSDDDKDETREESIIEEEIDENNTDDSTIKQLLDALDSAAKPMSERQIYVGCVLSSVKDYLQQMKDMKGEGYTMNYMKTHWPKINLAKVL